MRKLLTYILILTSVLAWAQNGSTIASGIPYECGFEESENLTPWKFNAGTTNTADQWMVGTAVHSEGKRALFVSSDGANPSYSNHPNVVVSYLRYKFPTTPEGVTGHYDVSFDWKGVGDSTLSRLYVMLCPEQQLTTPNSPYNLSNIVSLKNGNAKLSNDAERQCSKLGESGEKFVCGSETWQNVTLTEDVKIASLYSTQNWVIMLIWVNNYKDTAALERSAIAIDNFQINSTAVKKPTNVNVIPQCEDSTMLVTWESGLPYFDIEYRSTGAETWKRVSNITDGDDGFTRTDGSQCSYVLHRILEGSYDVRVRGRSTDDLNTSFVYKTMTLVYCPDNHCINFIDLHSPKIICTTGHHPGAQSGATPYDQVEIVDFGPDAQESRHTLHVDPTELDPRTDSLLNTVPNGALASVRLGNWKTGGEAESITYEIQVDSTNQGILLVKYAIVFQNPGGHPVEDEPAFKLEVIGPNGQIVDELCGQANFTYSDGAADGAAGWHITKDENVAWKEWTTVGLNLMPYHGQIIKVRFTTLDCGWSGHYAYAYFTVDCANAHILTENCGTAAQVSCMAPEGFAYMWYKDNNPDSVISRDQTLEVAATRTQYTCRVSFIEQDSCYFEISTTSEPRFPVPSYRYEWVYGECKSELKFTNTSHVMNKFDGEEHHTSEPCNESYWRFRSLGTGSVKETSSWSTSYTCPSFGDSIEVSCTAYIGAENTCEDTRTDTIVVPNIVPETSVLRTTTCPEAPVYFDGKWFETDTTYTAKYISYAGCDSTSILYLRVMPVVADSYRHDSICSDGSITIEGVRYNQPVENLEIMLKTSHGCDSAIYLTLTVNERIQAGVDSIPVACADEEQLFITLNINAGQFDSLGITFNTPWLRDTMIYDNSIRSITIPYPEDVTPGHYVAKLTFYQFCCGEYVERQNFEIRYRSSIVEQKWNDVLTVLSPKYNGGFEFTAFQWYKDGQPIPGETHSYLYQPLDFDSEYYVELTRSDGLVMTTCPVQPVHHDEQTPYPTIVKAAQRIPMYMEHPATIWYYTVSGQLVTTFGMPQGYTELPTPEQKGAYIIKSVNTQGDTNAHVILVE